MQGKLPNLQTRDILSSQVRMICIDQNLAHTKKKVLWCNMVQASNIVAKTVRQTGLDPM